MISRQVNKLRAITAAAIAVIAIPLSMMPASAQETPAAPPAATEAAAAPAGPDASAVAADTLAYFNNVAPTGPLVGLPGPGHNAFLMVCAALVLFMTLPGLALFYGGLVRHKNVLSVMAQCLGLAGMVTIMWFAFGYSMVFGEHPAEGAPGWAGIFGDIGKYAFLKDVGGAPNTNYTAWPSHSTFAMYQLMFAIITPALIVGAIAERMKYSAIMIFCAIWMVLVYFPMAHMVWGFDGLFNGVWNGGAKIPSIDFAGGTVVHMTSGWSALVLCLILGKRRGFGKQPMQPHSLVLCMVGTGMLWVGWYGFNAGSALSADGLASQAFMTTTLAAAVAAFTWGLVEKIMKGKVSVLGLCSGAVAGLVVITPGAGFVTAGSAVIMGILAAVVPYFFCTFVKSKFGYDDSLDTFGIHGVGGTLGAILTAIFANCKVNPNLVSDAYAKVNGMQAMFNLETGKASSALLINHFKVVIITIVLSVVVTAVVAFIIKAVIGLRPTEEIEEVGLDLAEHGEQGYEH
ncbi:MAG: ammonium transporter [Akkermansiaceae bacterium]|nr:ammonium transporter [Akkermansiaceae bacterium]